jgi:hypothetical protein
MVFKGNFSEDTLASLYYNAFEPLHFLPHANSFEWHGDPPEPHKSSLELLRSSITHFLDLSAPQAELSSVEAVLIQDHHRNPRLTISNVEICKGPMLQEAFHQIGGLKLWLVVMNEVSKYAKDALLVRAVLETFTVIRNLLSQESSLTLSEVSKDHLFDLLCAQLRLWKAAGVSGPEVFQIALECSKITWLYKAARVAVKTEDEGFFVEYRRNPGALRLIFNFKLWQDLDQSYYFKAIAGISEDVAGLECHAAMDMHILDYYMSLARHSPPALEKLKAQDQFFVTLRSHVDLRTLLMMLLYERSKSFSKSALQLILELSSVFEISEFAEYISSRDIKPLRDQRHLDESHSKRRHKPLTPLKSLLKNIYDLTVTLHDAPGTQDCLRYVGFTVEKLFGLRVASSSNRDEVPVLVLCEELVFKLAEVSSLKDTVRLIESYVDQCESFGLPYDFCRLVKIYFGVWSRQGDLEVLKFAADVLAQHFNKGEFNANYERLYVMCERALIDDPGFAEFILALMQCMASSHINSLILRLLLYWAEDLQRHLGVRISVDLLSKLLDLAVAEGIQHETDPKMPWISWASPILVEVERPTVACFSIREGGTLRILMMLLIRALLTEPPADCVRLIRDLLNIHRPDSYLHFKLQGQSEPSANFFGQDLNIVAYASGELLEMLSVCPHLRVPEVYSLVLDLLLANGDKLLNCLDLLQEAGVKYSEFIITHFAKVSASVCHLPRSICQYQVSRGPVTREEKTKAVAFEQRLKEIARSRQYDGLEGMLIDRSSDLSRLHDFLVAYASMRMKAMEQVRPTYRVSQSETHKFYEKPYYPTDTEQATEQLLYEKTRLNKNMQDYGTSQLGKLIRKLTKEFQACSNYFTPQYWKISAVCDALGRRMRLVPFKRGSSYHDRVNAKYLEQTLEKTSINIDDILNASMRPKSRLDSILSRRSSTPFTENAEMSNTYYIERLEQAVNPHESASSNTQVPSVVVECEYIRIDYAIYGELEVSADSIAFRSAAKPRPDKFDLASLKSNMRLRRSVKIWLACDIAEVVHKKFMQQRTALEVYTVSGRSFLFNLYTIKAIRRVVPFLGDKFKTSSNQSVQPWTKLWKTGQISNLEYLMALNKYSGRSYSDLGQYLVFPWVLANYSDRLTFTDSEFRDLSWPIGAVTEHSRGESRERYRQFEQDPDLVAYNYGSHYSSLGVVVHFLVRTEPFTQQAITFQDNHFDVADRLFYSVKLAWENSINNTGDYKELVPEFFYFPEFLRNLHSYNLGWRQTGEHVDTVELPVWADTQDSMSPYNFVYWHRRALEHPTVTRSLHKWIDLIFGCKHEDKASANVFQPLTYEHHFKEQLAMCDAENYPRETLIIQIAHFGQAPSRIFDKPHEGKTVDKKETGIFKDFDATSLREEAGQGKVRKSTSAIYGKSDSLSAIAVLRKKTKSCMIFEQSGKIHAYVFDEVQPDWHTQLASAKGAGEIEQIVDVPYQPIANCFAFTESRLIIACRFADNSFKLYAFKGSKLVLKETVHFHSALVVCLDSSEDSLLATADAEGVMALWDLEGSRFCTLRGVLRSQGVGIKQVTISHPLQLVMSLDLEGCIFLHDARSCELFNLLRPEAVPSYVSISSFGLIAAALPDDGPTIQIYSMNGSQSRAPVKVILGSLSSSYLETRRDQGIDSQDEVRWIQFSSGGDFVMSLGTLSFCIWPVYEPTLPYVLGSSSPIRTVAVDPDEKQILLGPHRRDFILIKHN